MLRKSINLLRYSTQNISFIKKFNKTYQKNTLIRQNIYKDNINDQFAIYQSNHQIQNINNNQLSLLRKLNLKDLAIKTKNHLISKQKRPQFWLGVQNQLIQRLQLTTQQNKIRSYSTILYSLAKSKNFNVNFQTQFCLLLPFATHQSFTMIVTSISRMGTFSKQFAFIVQKYYQQNKDKFNVRQRVAINYALTRNNIPFDTSLLSQIQSMNLKQLTTVIRILDQLNLTNLKILEKISHHVVLRRRQINTMDLGYLLQIFFKNLYFPQNLQKVFMYSYNTLKKNIDQHTFQKIWQYFPQMVNQNLLNIQFTECIIYTLKILYKRGRFTKGFQVKIKKDIKKIQNLQIRIKCQLHD